MGHGPRKCPHRKKAVVTWEWQLRGVGKTIPRVLQGPGPLAPWSPVSSC